MKTVVLEAVNNEEKISKAGNKYKACGIKVDGQWYNGFGNEQTLQWKAGDTVIVEFFQEEYNGRMRDKFKTISKTQLLEDRVAKLEDEVAKLVRLQNLQTSPVTNETPKPNPTPSEEPTPPQQENFTYKDDLPF